MQNIDASNWKFLISHHALERYQERFDKKAWYSEIEALLCRSVLDSRANGDRFILRGPNHSYFVVSELESSNRGGDRWFAVLTVITKKMVPDYRKRKGYSRKGKKKWSPEREGYHE